MMNDSQKTLLKSIYKAKDKFMFINKHDNKNNLCGEKISKIRKSQKLSQRELAELLSSKGLKIHKNAIQRIESGERFITDIELKIISKTLNVPVDNLL